MSTSNYDNSCHILILADFSGRDHQGLSDAASINQRKIYQVDRDNFDEVFERLNVKFKSPLAENAICFKEFEDMHPDLIYEEVALFSRLRALKRKLKNPTTFDSAAKEIYEWSGSSQPSDKKDTIDSTSDVVSNEVAFDDILTNTVSSSSQFDVHALIKEVVAPYVQPKPDPRLEELLQTIDEATSDLMRKIMHDPIFQSIESNWHGLNLLVRRIETDSKLKLFIADISQRELSDDSFKETQQSCLYQLIVGNRSAIGDVPYKVIMHTDIFGHQEDDIKGLEHLGKTAKESGATVFFGATEKLAGCESMSKVPDASDWAYSHQDEIVNSWNALRQESFAKHLVALAPRFISRMPYGKMSAPIESFKYEELPIENKHEHYLWASGAWLVTLLVAQNFLAGADVLALRANEIEGLPLHVFDIDGEAVVTPCAEICMLDSASDALRKVGISSIRSILNKDAVVIPSLESISV